MIFAQPSPYQSVDTANEDRTTSQLPTTSSHAASNQPGIAVPGPSAYGVTPGMLDPRRYGATTVSPFDTAAFQRYGITAPGITQAGTSYFYQPGGGQRTDRPGLECKYEGPEPLIALMKRVGDQFNAMRVAAKQAVGYEKLVAVDKQIHQEINKLMESDPWDFFKNALTIVGAAIATVFTAGIAAAPAAAGAAAAVAGSSALVLGTKAALSTAAGIVKVAVDSGNKDKALAALNAARAKVLTQIHEIDVRVDAEILKKQQEYDSNVSWGRPVLTPIGVSYNCYLSGQLYSSIKGTWDYTKKPMTWWQKYKVPLLIGGAAVGLVFFANR